MTNPELTHEVVARGICVKRGMILLCKNVKHGHLYLPGGHVDPGEPASAALVREVKEEMGLDSSATRYLGTAEDSFQNEFGETCEINLCFKLSIPAANPSKNPPSRESYIEFVWIPLADLTKEKFYPPALARAIPKWLAAKDRQNFASSY